MKVKDVVTTSLITVGPGAPFKEVAERMLDGNVSGLPVVDDQGSLLGLVTEADLVSKPAFGHRRHRSLVAVVDLLTGDARWAAKATALTAGEMMTTAVITASPNEGIQAVAQRMLERRVKRLPVLDDGRLVGIVSRRDLLRSFHRSDTEITAELTRKLLSALYAPDDHAVTAKVENGVVTLEGTVRVDNDLPVVEGLARDIPGVVHVVNRASFRELAKL
jgi:CBS domain-containing protein